MNNDFFTVTPDHITLLSSVYISWNDGEFGAPTIDPKRPYGNSYVWSDMAICLGIVSESDDDPSDFSDMQMAKMRKLHNELETVLQIVLSTTSFTCGLYKRERYSSKWVLAT